MAGINLILIDDEEMVRLAWEAEALKRGQHVLAVASAAELDDFELGFVEVLFQCRENLGLESSLSAVKATRMARVVSPMASIA